MNRLQYRKQLNNVIKLDDPQLVVLKGNWGCGKTHFWNEFVENELDKETREKYAYVSLFGHKNFESLQRDILIQVFSRNKYIDKLNDLLKLVKTTVSGEFGEGSSVSLGGAALGNALSLFKKNDLSGLLVCIDDFERKSSSLDYSEIMGFLSILKERYGTTIVLIMDENNLGEGNEGYIKYKEKIVDGEFKFEPDQKEVLEKILENIDDKYKAGVKEAYDITQEKNLRAVKKAVRNSKLLCDTIQNKCSDWCKKYVAYNVSLLTFVYSGLGYDGLDQLTNWRSDKKIENKSKEAELVEEYAYTYGTKVSGTFKFHKFLWEVIHTSLVDEEELFEFLKARELQKNKEEKSRQIFQILDDYTFDLSVSNEKFVEDVLVLLDEAGCAIFDFISMSNIDYLFSAMNQVSNEDLADRYLELKQKFVDRELTGIETLDDAKKVYNMDSLAEICNSDPRVKNLFGTKFNQVIEELYHIELIKERIEYIESRSGWGRFDEDFLNGASKQLLEEGIRTDPKFFVTVLRFVQSFCDENHFITFGNNIKLLIEVLKDELGDFRYVRVLSRIGKIPVKEG